MRNFEITLNPYFVDHSRFQVLTNGDKYLLTVDGRKICTQPTPEACIRHMETDYYFKSMF